MLPKIDSPVFHTAQGTPYLREAGVVLIGHTFTDLSGVRTFLEGFDRSLSYDAYLDDPLQLAHAEALTKFAGQLCYMSFSPKRTWNKDAKAYFDGAPDKPDTGIKGQKHGSVTEHAYFSYLLYGVSRSLTHELVRHRAGWAYSQLSQRYVGGKMLRFVERPEYVDDPFLHEHFESRIDRAFTEYEGITGHLAEIQARGRSGILSGEAKTELRKKVRQAARSLLPNETEAPIVATANARAIRHVLEMRASPHAETEIRACAVRMYKCAVQLAPILFGDYRLVRLPDGTEALENEFKKI